VAGFFPSLDASSTLRDACYIGIGPPRLEIQPLAATLPAMRGAEKLAKICGRKLPAEAAPCQQRKLFA
jgi:hypothetical protein